MRAIKKESIDRFYDYDIHIETRTLYLGQDIDDLSAERTIKGLHLLDSSDGNINIILSSPGGEVYNGMAIYDSILQCKNDVIISVAGWAMSMGSIILQAADYRLLHPNSVIMIHDGSWDLGAMPIKEIANKKTKSKVMIFLK